MAAFSYFIGNCVKVSSAYERETILAVYFGCGSGTARFLYRSQRFLAPCEQEREAVFKVTGTAL